MQKYTPNSWQMQASHMKKTPATATCLGTQVESHPVHTSISLKHIMLRAAIPFSEFTLYYQTLKQNTLVHENGYTT